MNDYKEENLDLFHSIHNATYSNQSLNVNEAEPKFHTVWNEEQRNLAEILSNNFQSEDLNIILESIVHLNQLFQEDSTQVIYHFKNQSYLVFYAYALEKFIPQVTDSAICTIHHLSSQIYNSKTKLFIDFFSYFQYQIIDSLIHVLEFPILISSACMCIDCLSFILSYSTQDFSDTTNEETSDPKPEFFGQEILRKGITPILNLFSHFNTSLIPSRHDTHLSNLPFTSLSIDLDEKPLLKSLIDFSKYLMNCPHLHQYLALDELIDHLICCSLSRYIPDITNSGIRAILVGNNIYNQKIFERFKKLNAWIKLISILEDGIADKEIIINTLSLITQATYFQAETNDFSFPIEKTLSLLEHLYKLEESEEPCCFELRIKVMNIFLNFSGCGELNISRKITDQPAFLSFLFSVLDKGVPIELKSDIIHIFCNILVGDVDMSDKMNIIKTFPIIQNLCQMLSTGDVILVKQIVEILTEILCETDDSNLIIQKMEEGEIREQLDDLDDDSDIELWMLIQNLREMIDPKN